jgi:hypothetical protein
VIDGAGEAWRIYERWTRGEPGARADACLVFESASVVRRAWTYPENWHDLSGASLLAIMERPRHD